MDIRIGNTFFSLSAFISMVIIAIIGILIILLSIHNLYRTFHPKDSKQRWIKTTARLTGQSNRFIPQFPGKYTIAEESAEYEAEYWVSGIRYVKYIQIVSATQKGIKVDLLYDSRHPSRIREDTEIDNPVHNKKGTQIGIYIILICIGIGMLLLSLGSFIPS